MYKISTENAVAPVPFVSVSVTCHHTCWPISWFMYNIIGQHSKEFLESFWFISRISFFFFKDMTRSYWRCRNALECFLFQPISLFVLLPVFHHQHGHSLQQLTHLEKLENSLLLFFVLLLQGKSWVRQTLPTHADFRTFYSSFTGPMVHYTTQNYRHFGLIISCVAEKYLINFLSTQTQLYGRCMIKAALSDRWNLLFNK